MPVLAVLTYAGTVAAEAGNGPTLEPILAQRVDETEAFVRQEARSADFPGGAYAIVAEGEVVRVGAFGKRDLEMRRPATAHTPYWIASITKVMTGLAVLRLRDEGRLTLDDPVQQHLPWFQLADRDASEQLTIRDLLRHQTGLPTNAHRVVWDDEARIRQSMEEGVRALRDVELQGRVGEGFAYSNMNYAVLGLVVEAASGTGFEQYLQEEVLGRAGMVSTTFPVDEAPAGHAKTYIPSFGSLGVGPVSTGRFLVPASSAWSTAEDMGAFAAALMRSAEAGGFEAHVAGSADDSVSTAWKGVRYGYGLNHVRSGEHEVAGHLGNASHSSALFVIPEKRLGLVLLVGGYSPARTRSISEGALRILAGDEAPSISGPSDLTALLWVSRGMVLATGLSVLLLVTLLLSVLRRLREGLSPLSRAMVARTGFLTALAPALFWFGIDGVRQIWSDLPAPTGFGTAPLQGYPSEVAMALAGAALTATAWAVYALLTAYQAHRRKTTAGDRS